MNRWALVLLLLTSPASAGEVRTIDGKVHLGDIASLEPTEVRLKIAEGDKLSIFALKDVISIDMGLSARPLTRVPYLRVRLIDGSQLYCLTVNFTPKTMTLLLLSGQSLTVNFDQVHHLVCEAQDSASLAAFDALQADNPKSDMVRLRSKEGTSVENYEGLIVGSNDAGNRLQFKARGLDNVSNIDVDRLRALYFQRSTLGTNDKAIARLTDSFGSTYTVTRYVWGDTWCDVTLQTGQDLKLLRSTIARFDLTPGKMAYLSDLEPSKVEETPILSELYHYRRDKNLEGGQLSVGRRVYTKGLSLHSRTVLEYPVAGYSSFRTVLGLDDAMTGSAHAVVRIEGDDRELLNTVISSRENKPQDVVLELKGVKVLRLIVDYGDDLDLGDHINFADARLVK
jgi:hypothetical protein